MTLERWKQRLRHARKRIRGLNIKIRKRRRKGQKTPELAEQRRKVRKKVAYLEAHPPPPAHDPDGLIWMDGKQVVEWIGRIALAARAAGAWHGILISGFRTPEFSEWVCINEVCGHPTCAGTCAGRGSRHSEKGEGHGAGDFSHPEELDAYCRKHNLPLIGNGRVLSNDVNHFSREGN